MVQAIHAPQTSPKLSDVLFPTCRRNFGTIAGVPSNCEGVDAALTFANGIHPYVALVGPTGWGKTHLMEAAAGHMTHEQRIGAPIYSAIEWAERPDDFDEPLLLDNVQDALARPRLRCSLRQSIERRMRLGRPTLVSFTGARPSRQLRSLLPSSRDWVVATIRIPDARERLVIVAQLASAEGVSLSQGLAYLLAFKMRGNGRTLVGALKRLRLYGPNWQDARATLKACGILDPFFADNSAWDLKEQILRISSHQEFRYGAAGTTDMALFTMLREAYLSEADIARFLGIGPSEVYLRAAKFEEQASLSPMVHQELNVFVETVVDSLLRD